MHRVHFFKLLSYNSPEEEYQVHGWMEHRESILCCLVQPWVLWLQCFSVLPRNSPIFHRFVSTWSRISVNKGKLGPYRLKLEEKGKFIIRPGNWTNVAFLSITNTCHCPKQGHVKDTQEERFHCPLFCDKLGVRKRHIKIKGRDRQWQGKI